MATSSFVPMFTPRAGYGTQVGGYNYVQTSPQGGAWSNRPATPVPAAGQVQGVSTGGILPPPPAAPAGNQNTGGQPQLQQQQQGPSEQDQLRAELDQIFNPVFGNLDQQESTLAQNYAPVEGQIQAQGDLSKQMLTDQQTSGMRELDTQGEAAGTRKTDALTSASRLFNELQRGGQQRFGGSSSAGEAFQSLTATEQQRRQGGIEASYETAMQQVGTFKANLNDKYQTAIKEVQFQVTEAVNEAKKGFRDALQQISSMKAQAQSDKATASMNVLQDLRNKVYSINQQSLQFAQQLALNHEMSLKTVDEYAQRATQSLTGARSAVSSMNPDLSTSYGITGGQTNAPLAQTGRTTPRRPEDEEYV